MGGGGVGPSSDGYRTHFYRKIRFNSILVRRSNNLTAHHLFSSLGRQRHRRRRRRCKNEDDENQHGHHHRA